MTLIYQHENLGGIKYPLRNRILVEDIKPPLLVQITIPKEIQTIH